MSRKRKNRNRKDRKLRSKKLLPRFAAAIWPTPHPPLPPDLLQYLFGAIREESYTTTRHTGGGKPFQCFGNVAEKIAIDGGRAVLGWAVEQQTGEGSRFFRMIVDTHCVWQSPDGTLFDLTPRYEIARFIHNPSCTVGNASIFFLSSRSFLPSYRGTRQDGGTFVSVRLDLNREHVPRPVVSISGRELAETIQSWQFSTDAIEAARMRTVFDSLLSQ